MQVCPLEKSHDRDHFDCGIESLNRYLKNQARQDMRRNIAATFVLVGDDNSTIKGYYSLAACSVDAAFLPEQLQQKMPNYQQLPATLLGRLAINHSHQEQGLGQWLLMNALERILQHTQSIPSMAVIVDAINQQAEYFYRKHNFLPLQANRLFIEMQLLKKLFLQSNK